MGAEPLTDPEAWEALRAEPYQSPSSSRRLSNAIPEDTDAEIKTQSGEETISWEEQTHDEEELIRLQ